MATKGPPCSTRLTLLVSNACVPLKQDWSTKKKKRASFEAKPNRSLWEKKNKVWLRFLSLPGTSWVSIRRNELFGCLKNTARFISVIQNGIKHTWYIIKHIHFFLFFPSQSLQRQRSWILLPLKDGLDYFPFWHQTFCFQSFMGFLFPILKFQCKRQTQAHGATMPVTFFPQTHYLSFFTFKQF